MFKAAIKSLLGHKLRMFLTGFAIILGTSFVAGTYIFTDSISRTFDGIFNEVYEGVDLTVRAPISDFGSSEGTFDEAVLEKVRAVEGVEFAEPGVSGFAQPLNKEGEPIGGNGPPSLGFSWTRESSLTPLMISDGRPPESSDEVVIDKATADANEYVVGDSIDMLLLGPVQTYQVVGIATFGENDGLAGATISSFELREAQEVFGLEGSYSYIDIKSAEGTDISAVTAAIEAAIPADLEVVTGQQQANEQLDEISEGLGFINTAILAFAAVAIFVGAFIIQNTFRIVVSQRTKELALLRAIGATRFQVVKVVLYEALLVGIFASAIGIGLGVLISYAIRGLLNAVGLSLPAGPLTVETRTIVVSMSVGVIVTMLSAVLPAIKASRVAPVEAMRSNEVSQNTRKSLLLRGIITGLVSAIGVLLLVLGLNNESLSNPVYYVGIGAGLMFVGVSGFAPLLSGPLAVVIGWPARMLKGISAKLATDNVKRTPRRTASSAAALMIGVSLVVFVSVLAASFKGAIQDIVSENFPAEITFISTQAGDEGPGSGGFSTQLVDDIQAAPELAGQTAVLYDFDGLLINDEPETLAAVTSANFEQVIRLNPSEGAIQGLAEGGLVVSESVLEDRSLVVGDIVSIEVSGGTGPIEVEISGSFNEPFDTNVLIDLGIYSTYTDVKTVTYVASNVADGFTAEEAKDAAIKLAEPYVTVDVLDFSEIVEQAEGQIDQILALIWALLGFAIVIAVLGITNTLMLSISERTREIGMLRAIGMTRRQVRSMVRYESIIIALFGALLGVSMGIFFGWAVMSALESEGIESFVIPYGQIVAYFVIAAIAGIFAAAWPARKAARMNVLDAISTE